MKRIVITGLGTFNPIGKNIEEFTDSLKEGKSGASYITRFDADKFKTRFACQISNYDPLEHFNRKEVRKLDLFSQYALLAARETISSAGIGSGVNRSRLGVIWSSGIGGMPSFEDQLQEHFSRGQEPKFSPFLITNLIPNMPAGLISIEHGFKGPSYAPVSACTSSAHAIINAAMIIQMGMADAVLAGGSESAISPAAIGGFNSIKALSTRNDAPKQASRPFDKARDGFVMGEGAGGLMIESLEHALNRNAKVYAELVGFGMTSDAYHITASDPEGDGAFRCMAQALAMAQLEPRDIVYYNAHATSTPTGDISEIKAFNRLLESQEGPIHLGAVKSMTGHLLGAAGAVESIASILAMNSGFIPPTINTQNLDPELDRKFVVSPCAIEGQEVNYSLSNNFGFGGHNASLVFKRFTS